MLAYIIRRLLFLPVVMFFATLIIFGLLSLMPKIVQVSAFVGTNPSAFRSIDTLIEKHGLNDPIHVRWWNWVTNILQGDFGYSSAHNMPVSEALFSFLPATLELLIASIGPILLIGVTLGVISAVHQNKLPDHASRVFSVFFWSLPTFAAGLFFLMIFYGILGWVTDGRLSVEASQVVASESFIRHTGMNTVDGILNGNWLVFWDALKHLILPAVTISLVVIALIVRVMRSSMLNTLREDYVNTARAKGVEEQKVIHKHARRNAMIPVLSTSGLLVAFLFTGVATAEIVFNFKGIGFMFIVAANQQDIPMTLGFTLFASVIFVLINLLVDILYSVYDPRVRLD